MKFKKLWSLINRNVVFTLTDPNKKEVYYYGNLRSLPDAYGSWVVHDLIEISSYEYMIVVTEQ